MPPLNPPPPWRHMRPSVRLQIAGATILTITTIAVISCSAHAQSPPTQLPGLVVQAQKTKPSTKRRAQPTTRASAAPTVRSPAAPATALGSYNPALDLPDLVLPPGTVLTTAGPIDGYRALSAMSSTKTATPIERIPQSIQVLPKELLDDQRPISVGDALQNVSNAQGPNDLGIGNTDMAALKLRGFGAEQWVDGMAVHYDAGHRDAFSNVERIDVLKGPSAILYGGGPGSPIGGAVNLISKLPTNVASGEVGMTVGSHDYLRTFFDINQPITSNGTVLFRMTGEYGAANSFIDILDSERYAINPTLTFTNKTDTTLTIQGSFSKFTQQAYPGLPAVGTVAGNFRINPWMFPGDPTIKPSFSKRDAVTVTFDHRFDPVWSFNAKARYSRSVSQQDSQAPSTAAPDMGGTTWSLMNVAMYQVQEEFTINPNLQARFAFDQSKHVVLFGADYSRVTDKGYMTSDSAGVVDLTNPVFGLPFSTPFTRPDPSSPFYFKWYDFNGAYTTKGAYAQIQSTFLDRVHVLAGARLASLDISYREEVPYMGGGFYPPETFSVDKTKLLPRVGAVVDIAPGLSVFGSYSEGMRWTAFTQAQALSPEESQQIEAGLKFKVGPQLSGTMSVFDIKRTNVPVVIGFGVSDTAEQHARGFEADVIWQPTPAWKILAAYGYTDAEYSDAKLAPEGNKLTGVPAHSGRLWVNYAFDERLKGLSIGAGIYASSSQFVDIANLYETRGFFTIDSKIAYDAGSWTAAVHVKNLTGEKYFEPYTWFGGQVAPGAPREVFGTVTYKF